MPLELAILHAKQKQRVPLDGPAVLGRSKPGAEPDIDLSFDASISRPHAKLFPRGEVWFIEDLDSRWGTKLNGTEIRGRGPQPFRPGDTLIMGETTLRLHGAGASTAPGAILKTPPGTVRTALAAADSKPPTGANTERLQMLYELPLSFAEEADADGLLQSVVDRLVAVLPNVTRAGLLLVEGDALLLAAHVSPPGVSAAVSETLARRVIDSGEGIIWRDDAPGGDAVTSMIRQNVHTGMYAPLTFGGHTYGALCADNPSSGAEYAEDDLRLMLAVANYAAMALTNLRLQKEVRREATAKANLARQFSPQVVEWLFKQKGRTRLGGSRLGVTILTSDVRGFTRTSADMEPDDVVDMLNAYFTAMVPIVHAEGGIVDKFIGDAILAIWGFPPPDEQQHVRAVRAALAMRGAIAHITAERTAAGLPICEIGIGVHSGEVLQGFIGSDDRQEFTVIGDAVNKAARYCDGALPGEVLISPQVHARVWKHCTVESHEIDTKNEGKLRCFRVLEVGDE
ncbi:MAG: adenylate/guanylate cyclase domain-containing protein [Planctomycetota bacterium]